MPSKTIFNTSSLNCLLTMQPSSHQTTKMHPKIIHVTLNELKQPDFEDGKKHAFTPRSERRF
jgi:hypothetical protein